MNLSFLPCEPMPNKKTSSVKKVVRKATDSLSNQSIRATSVVSSAFPKSVREYWEQLDWGGLFEHFGNKTLQRGRNYAGDGNVQSLWVTKNGKNLLAVVVGTHDYKTRVTLEEGRRKNQFVPSSTCSCPVGSDCKHGVATIVRFLDFLVNNKPIPLCRELEDDTWEIVTENEKTKTMKIDFDEYDDDDSWEDDEHEWNDDDEPQVFVPKTFAKTNDLASDLEVKLNGKSSKELVAIILRLFNDYDNVREHFKQEAFAESVAKSGNIAKLVEKAIKLIDKAVDGVSYEHRRYGDCSALELNPVTEIIKQFGKFDDALAAVDRVARYLIKKGCRYADDTGAEDTSEINLVFDAMAKTLIASKTPPVSIILWAYEVSRIDEYDFGGYAFKTTIFDRAWPIKVWSGVADALLAKMYENIAENRDFETLRSIVETLDKASRQKEATDLLRTEAVHIRKYEMLVDRLIEFAFLDEAEKIAWEQRQIELKQENRSDYYYRNDLWPDRLKKIAEKKKDWPMQASIEAVEFFEHPCDRTILPLLQTAKKMKVEPAVRRSLEAFLQTGEFPTAVQKELEGAKPTTKDRQSWPIPFFAFVIDEKKQQPRFDVLCDWAIAEKRPKDVVRWFDELSKQKENVRKIDDEKVADAIIDTHPDRAFRLYRDLAEHEMEATRNYPSAVRLLRKARKTLEALGRAADWPTLIAEIRATHRRKSSLMKQLDELNAGSIVNQKRRGK